MWGAIIGAGVSLVGGKLLGKSSEKAAKKANSAVTDANKVQAQIAQDQWNRYKEIYEPLERQMVNDAQNYASPENFAKAAGEASTTVSQQFSKARERLGRTPGLDPSSGAYQSSLVGLELAQASTDATQQNIARQGVKDTAYSRQLGALGLGKGLDSTAASGLASTANANRLLALGHQAQAAGAADAFGRITDRVVSGLTSSNWLGGGNSAAPGNTNQAGGGGLNFGASAPKDWGYQSSF